jgi:hypothetical protein
MYLINRFLIELNKWNRINSYLSNKGNVKPLICPKYTKK